MSNRAVAPLLAVLLSSLAGAALTVSAVAAPATDDKAEATANECLAAPNAATPKGSHWYYRLEKGTKRKCWYLGDQMAKATKPAAAAPAPSANPAPPRAPEAAMQPSVANARAELASRAPKSEAAADDATLSETIWPQPEAQADSVAGTNDQGSNSQLTTTGAGAAAIAPAQDGAITSRWPDSNLPAAPDNASAGRAESRSSQNAASQTAAQPKGKSAAHSAIEQSTGISVNSTPMLLIMFAGVLIIVAVAARMIMKYVGSRQANNKNSRRSIWDKVTQDNGTSDAYESLLEPRRSESAAVPADANDPSHEIEELLRASKRAAA